MNEFVKTLSDEKEQLMIERLLRYGTILHWEKLQEWVKIQLSPKDDYFFIILTYITVLGVTIGLQQFNISNIWFWVISVLITFAINLFNGSLSKSMFKKGYKKV